MKKQLLHVGAAVAVTGLVASAGQFAFAAEPINYKQSFSTPLSGAQQVPPISSDAAGTALFNVSQDERQIDYSVAATKTPNIVAGHIHCGAAGMNGPVIVDLVSAPVAMPNGEFASGSISDSSIKPVAATCSVGSITNTQQLVQAMREGKLYVNIHTTEYPDGLIRGQIGAQAATPTPVTPPVAAAKSTVLATANPDGVANDALVGLSRNLEAAITKFKNFAGVTSIQSVQVDKASGAAYVTYDGPNTTGGVLKVSDVDSSANYEVVAGSGSGLVAPKGIELVPSKDAYIVSDNGAKAVTVFANGSATPLFSVTNLGATSRSVWDTSYDKASDTLYAAGTDGVVMVYDDFFADKGVYGPTKLLVPSSQNGTKLSVNLHGIVYVAERDSLVLSDVGSATVATDGQLFTLSNVRNSSGKMTVDSRITGANTKLGNPVDLAYDGQHLLVAEKSNDLVLQFNDIFGRQGDSNVAATYSRAVTKPESVSLY